MKITCPNFIKEILDCLNEHGYQAFMVGGCVRDALLGVEASDYDITTNAKTEVVESLFEHTIPTGKKHGTTTVLSEQAVEITTYRIDNELESDLAHRDFTINAMAYHPQIGLIDPFDGQKDLKNGIIRAVGNPLSRFEEDPLRMLRAHRFAARYRFDIEEETKLAIEQCSSLLSGVAVERVRSELLQILESNPYEIENMTKLMAIWMPELEACRACEQTTPYHDTNVLHHILRACALLKPYDETCMYAIFMHDLAKPACKTTSLDGLDHFKGHPLAGVEIAKRICKDFKLTNQQKKEIPLLVQYHDEKMIHPYQFIEKFRIELGWKDELLQKLFRVKYCDIMAHSPFGQKTIQSLYDQMEIYEQCKKERPLSLDDLKINGKDVINETKVEKSEIKKVLKEVLLMAFKNPEMNERNQLLEYIRWNY